MAAASSVSAKKTSLSAPSVPKVPKVPSVSSIPVKRVNNSAGAEYDSGTLADLINIGERARRGHHFPSISPYVGREKLLADYANLSARNWITKERIEEYFKKLVKEQGARKRKAQETLQSVKAKSSRPAAAATAVTAPAPSSSSGIVAGAGAGARPSAPKIPSKRLGPSGPSGPGETKKSSLPIGPTGPMGPTPPSTYDDAYDADQYDQIPKYDWNRHFEMGFND